MISPIGSIDAKVLIIVEKPNRESLLYEEPIAGLEKALVNRLLHMSQVKEKDVYITSMFDKHIETLYKRDYLANIPVVTETVNKMKNLKCAVLFGKNVCTYLKPIFSNTTKVYSLPALSYILGYGQAQFDKALDTFKQTRKEVYGF